MKHYLKSEWYKVRHNRLFWCSLAVGLMLAVISAVLRWKLYDSDNGTGGILKSIKAGDPVKDNILVFTTLFSSVMSGDIITPTSNIFFLITPLLAALPCGWSFSEELHSSYLHTLVSLKSRKEYFSAKTLVSFLEGGLLLVIPQLVNLWLLSLHVPAVKPHPLYAMYTPIPHGGMFSRTFYLHPLLYLFLILSINFIFGGFFALLSLTTTFFVRTHLASVIVPYLAFLVIDSFRTFQAYLYFSELSPLYLLHPLTSIAIVQLHIVLLWFIILFFVTVPVIMKRGCSLEIL